MIASATQKPSAEDGTNTVPPSFQTDACSSSRDWVPANAQRRTGGICSLGGAGLVTEAPEIPSIEDRSAQIVPRFIIHLEDRLGHSNDVVISAWFRWRRFYFGFASVNWNTERGAGAGYRSGGWPRWPLKLRPPSAAPPSQPGGAVPFWGQNFLKPSQWATRICSDGGTEPLTPFVFAVGPCRGSSAARRGSCALVCERPLEEPVIARAVRTIWRQREARRGP